MNRATLAGCLAALAVVAGLAACSSPRVPLAIDPSMRPLEISTIVVLPVLDARSNPADQGRAAGNAQEAMVRLLRDRGYKAVEAAEWARRPEASLDPRVATADQILSGATDDGDWLMVVRVERLEPSYESNQTFDARLSAAMVDRAHRQVVWRDVATASGNWSGALTFLGRGSVQYDAISSTTRTLVSTLPDRKDLIRQQKR